MTASEPRYRHIPKGGRKGYFIYAITEGGHTLMWLPIQHVALPLIGHQAGRTTVVQTTSETATYLIPVTVVASVNYRPDHASGDYAAYMGTALPTHTDDRTRVEYIARHGNKVEGTLAEHLFRRALDHLFGKGVIKYRA